MAYQGQVWVIVQCGMCGKQIRGWFYSDEPDDTVTCDCGRKYLVTRPHRVECEELRERLDL